jgi:hypothetical protein
MAIKNIQNNEVYNVCINSQCNKDNHNNCLKKLVLVIHNPNHKEKILISEIRSVNNEDYVNDINKIFNKKPDKSLPENY